LRILRKHPAIIIAVQKTWAIIGAAIIGVSINDTICQVEIWDIFEKTCGIGDFISAVGAVEKSLLILLYILSVVGANFRFSVAFLFESVSGRMAWGRTYRLWSIRTAQPLRASIPVARVLCRCCWSRRQTSPRPVTPPFSVIYRRQSTLSNRLHEHLVKSFTCNNIWNDTYSEIFLDSKGDNLVYIRLVECVLVLTAIELFSFFTG